MNKPLWKQLLPYVSAVLLFAALTFTYLSPMLKGKVLKQHDITQWRGSYEEINQHNQKHPEDRALWTNSMFSGMPAYQIGMDYPSNKIYYVTDLLTDIGFKAPASSLFLLMIGFFLLLLAFDTSPWVAMVGAVAFGFSSYNFINIEAGHETKVMATALIPLVMAGIAYAYKGKYVLGAALTALGLAMQLKANHLQITYYMAIMIGIWAIFILVNAIQQKTLPTFLKASAFLLIGGGIGIGMNITNLLLTEEYGKETIRGKSELVAKLQQSGVNKGDGLDKDYALNWSNGKLEPLTILVPNLYGGASQLHFDNKTKTAKFLRDANSPEAQQALNSLGLYWGPQPMTSGPIYFGALVVFLFVLGMFLIKGNARWWLLIVTVLAILLSMGKNLPILTNLFFDHFPLYSKFRSVTMMMTLAQVLMPLGAFLAIKELWEDKINWQDFKLALRNSVFIVGGILILLLIWPFDYLSDEEGKANFPPELLDAMASDRKAILRIDVIRSLFFIGAGIALMWFTVKGRLKKEIMIAGLGVLILVDLWTVDKRYLKADNFQDAKAAISNEFPKTEADQYILADKDPDYRVMNFTVSPFNDATTSYYHKSIGGYHGAKLRRYQELIEYVISPELQMLSKGFSDSAMQSAVALNMLNTRYFILGQSRQEVFKNPHALGNAWFVNDVLWVENADQEIDTLKTINPSRTAVIEASFKQAAGTFAPMDSGTSDSIKLASYSPNKLTYTSHCSAGRLAVFSEIYYPKGWVMRIDGKEAPILQANYVLRAANIPAGDHTIEFSFEPQHYIKGEQIAGISSMALLILALVAIGWEVRSRMKNKQESNTNE